MNLNNLNIPTSGPALGPALEAAGVVAPGAVAVAAVHVDAAVVRVGGVDALGERGGGREGVL